VAKGLSYADAVVLLGGGPRNRVVAALDRLTGGVLLVASATGAALPLSLFDAKAELFRLSDELVGSVTGQLRRAKRASRTERLAAANSVLVIAAFFDALRAVPLPFDVDDLEITAEEQVAVATGAHPRRDLAGSLLRSPVPVPQPQRPYEDTLTDLRRFYDDLGSAVLRFFSGLAVWERLPDNVKQDAGDAVRTEVTARAVDTYVELFRRLAAEFPEVAFWANLVDHQATRVQVRELRIAFNGLADTLADISTGSAPDEVRTRLARSYHAYLRRPALTAQDVPGGLRVPATGESYINPDFRVAVGVSVEDVAKRDWWEQQPRRTDLQQFLVGYLTSPAATVAPLVVMGQPGSGKSLLTQVLAARLPANDFFAIRVALRDLDADADLQTHIEQSVRAATGEHLTWRRLVEAAGDATPVVLVDGFDELLQATGLSQSSYLERIAAFQQRESDQGCPVVVVVTTRMSVAHRARPVEDMVTVLLEPFDDDQVAHWLAVWNDRNREWLATRGLRTLPVDVALAQDDLAAQPLLLLMLALYDAEDNSLQREEADLNEAVLYERLLTAFARREVLKADAELTEEQVAEAIDHELLVLSVVAFAMFNRQQLWVSEADLDRDLLALLGMDRRDRPAALTAAQMVAGRFYFVHVAQAVRDTATLRTFEFLHATFGEYLVAREVVRAFTRSGDDSVRHALLSFVPLTTQPNTVRFIRSLIDQQASENRERLVTLLLRLFQGSLASRAASLDDYRPVRASVPSRYAAYSANLFLLAVIAAGEVDVEQLFPDDAHVEEWVRTARLWQSQLPVQGWRNLTHCVAVAREWDGPNRRVRIMFDEVEPPSPDPYWTYGFSPESRYRRPGSVFSWIHDHPALMRAEAAFLCAVNEDIYVHALEPLFDRHSPAVTTFHDFRERGPVSGVQALLTLWVRVGEGAPREEIADAAETCLRIALHGFAPFEAEGRRHFRVLLFNNLVAIRHTLPDGWVAGLAARFETESRVDDRDELLDLTRQIVGNDADR
jgi:hypothetical protein